MTKNKIKKCLISETLRDRAKRMKIWDHMGYNGQDVQNFENLKLYKLQKTLTKNPKPSEI